MTRTVRFVAGSRKVSDSPPWYQPMIWKVVGDGPKTVLWESPGVYFSLESEANDSAAEYLAVSIAQVAKVQR